jgi:hypothetical protein
MGIMIQVYHQPPADKKIMMVRISMKKLTMTDLDHDATIRVGVWTPILFHPIYGTNVIIDSWCLGADWCLIR